MESDQNNDTNIVDKDIQPKVEIILDPIMTESDKKADKGIDLSSPSESIDHIPENSSHTSQDLSENDLDPLSPLSATAIMEELDLIPSKEIYDLFQRIQGQIDGLNQRIDLFVGESKTQMDKKLNEFNEKISPILLQLESSKQELKENLTQIQSDFYDKIGETRNDIDQTFLHRLEIERKLDEELDNLLLQTTKKVKNASSTNKAAWGMNTMFSGFLPGMGMGLGTGIIPGLGVGQKGQKLLRRRKITFEMVEQVISSKYATGLAVRSIINAFIKDSDLENQSKNRSVLEILRKIQKKVQYDERQVISAFTKEYLLSHLDNAMSLYRNLNKVKTKISSKALLLMMDNLIKRVQAGTNSTILRGKIEDFLTALNGFDPYFDPFLVREIQKQVQELHTMGTVRLSYFHQNKYSTNMVRWKRSLEKWFCKGGGQEHGIDLKNQYKRILIRLKASPVANEFRNQLGQLRATMALLEFANKSQVLQECEKIEKELVKIGNLRLTTVDKEKFLNIMAKWEKSFDALQTNVQFPYFEPILNWLDQIIQDKTGKAEKEIYKLVVMIGRLGMILKQRIRDEKIIYEIENFKESIEKQIYDQLTVDSAKRIKSQFEKWNNEVVNVLKKK